MRDSYLHDTTRVISIFQPYIYNSMEQEYIDHLNTYIETVNEYNKQHKLDVYDLIEKQPEGTHLAIFSKKLQEEDTSEYMFVKVSENAHYILGVFPEEYKELRNEDNYQNEITHMESVLYVKSSKVRSFRNHRHITELTKRNKRFFKIKISVPTLDIKEATYAAFQLKPFNSKKKCINDCTAFTEYMLLGKSSDTCVFRPKDFSYALHATVKQFPEEEFEDELEYDSACEGWFGNTNRHNVRLAMIAKQYYESKVNQNLVVEKGDAITQIFTCWFNYKESIEDPETGATILLQSVPYHSVPVLEVDSNIFITAEADAGNLKMERPVFDMYSMDPESGQTFWDRTRDVYSCKKEYRIKPDIDSEPVAFVLKSG